MIKIKDIITNNDFESVEILRHLAQAHRYLGELKGLVKTIPNQAIIVNTLGLQEAQDSSAIENIITTQDEIYKHLLNPNNLRLAAKEVAYYADALHFLCKKNNITLNNIIETQKIIIGNNAGIRQQPGTKLVNDRTGKIVYTPPEPNELLALLSDLELFINDDALFTNLDPLIKMAIIHHQFESIHPFYDGNGRIGRIINVVYLIQKELLDTPILYLSRYINHNKNTYYTLLQSVRDENTWQDWIIFILQGIVKTSQSTISLINKIRKLQQEYKQIVRTKYEKIYSQELLNNIFKHPYTKIAFLQEDLQVSRLTASRYLDQLFETQLLSKHKLGKENYYLNNKLIDLLGNVDDLHNE